MNAFSSSSRNSANARQAYELAIAGAIGAVFGLYLYTELVQASSVYVRDAFAGVAIGGTLGFFLNGSGPLRDGAWLKLARAGTWGAIAGAAGGAAGLVPALLLWTRPGASHGQVGLTAGVVARNAGLLWDPCLPWALGAKVYFARNAMDYAPWDAPPLVRALSAVGAASLVLGMVAGGALVFARRVPWAVRRLGLAGSVALPVTLLGFLTSVMVMDHFSARYLAAIILACPFALGPVAVLMGPRRFAWAFAPFLLTSAIAGWVAYGPFVRGAWPVVVSDARPDVTRGDDELEAALTSRGVRYAMADYWVAYRLTFLFRERVVVVPTHAAEDRHPPYRAAFAASPRVAYVYDPLRSREAPGELEAEVRAGATAFERDAERVDVGRFSVLLLRARP